MKLLVVSHSCVTPINQQLYAEVHKQTGWEIAIVVPESWRDEYGRILPSARWPGFGGEIIGIPVLRSGNIILHAYKTSFRKLIQRMNPDAIYVNHEPYAVATAQVYLGNRLSGRRPIGFYSCQNINKRYPPPFSWSERYVLRNSDFACPISPSVDNVLKAKSVRADRYIVPLGIDTDFFRRSPPFDTVAAAQAPHCVRVGFVGRLVESKGLRTLLTAASMVTDLPWQLVLVGSGPMEPELRQLVVDSRLADRVVFSGFIPHEQMPAVLSTFDILVLPSETQLNWKEQFGRVLLEAMACGAAVIGSNSGEIPVLIRETGGGLTFPERDPRALADAIRHLVSDSSYRSQLAQAGFQAVRDRFSLKSAANTLVSAIRASIEQHAATRMKNRHP